MTADEARAELRELGDVGAAHQSGLYADRPSGLGLGVGVGWGGVVTAVMVSRPEADDDTVHYRGVDVFGRSAREVVGELSRLTTVHPGELDDASFVAPDLLLALWRPFAADDDPAAEQGYYFNSVVVARPGYYDSPAGHAARGEPPGC